MQGFTHQVQSFSARATLTVSIRAPSNTAGAALRFHPPSSFSLELVSLTLVVFTIHTFNLLILYVIRFQNTSPRSLPSPCRLRKKRLVQALYVRGLLLRKR